jgi:nucleotide-binding universal stress UspA family protein
MVKSILLPLLEGSTSGSAREYAFWLAQKQAGQIHGLGLIDVKSFEIPVLGTPDGFMPAVVTPPLQESQRLLNEMSAQARERLEQLGKECASEGIPCSTDLRIGIPGEIVTREAVAHDIVVLARANYGVPERLDALVPGVIRGSIRPVLVAGGSFRNIRHILIAYDGSIHAARALLIAAELGALAEIRSTLVNVSGSEEAGQETLAPAEAYLSHHGVTPRKKVLAGTRASDLICEIVTSSEADLLVMGAYGHSPIREMIFGSTTERVLSHCGSSVVLQS